MMPMYVDQTAKNAALRKLLDDLSDESRASNPDVAMAYQDVAQRLRRILDRPVAEDVRVVEPADNIPDMAVVVHWPLIRGQMQTAVFDRDGGPEPETLTNHDRVILRALLASAMWQVPSPVFGGKQ